MPTTYRKTDKGRREIETRQHGLSPRMRGALIMVDGQRSDEVLRTMIMGDPEAALRWLLDEGFIEVVAVTEARPVARPAPAPVAAPPPPPAPAAPQEVDVGRTLEERKRRAVRYLNDRLGPSAEGVALKIERARDVRDVLLAFESAERLLAMGRGAAAGTEFRTLFIDTPLG
ncbi:MAG: hypothetical protein MUC74_03410 [Ideonella sp.]|jgi:hypothetical protein|nr:hypothetical protein [Ideonella sp.]